MTEENRDQNRDLVAELIEELFATGNFNHLDGYGGALFVLDLEEAIEALRKKGWTMVKEKTE